jgi:hypothetical protein
MGVIAAIRELVETFSRRSGRHRRGQLLQELQAMQQQLSK